MGRKKATKTLSSYFPHDSNARNDERLVNVRMKHGPAGYGVYFMPVSYTHLTLPTILLV